MRKILMSEKGEFKSQGKTDYVRATAVKMMASVIKEPEKGEDEKVMISSRALQQASR